MALMGLGTSIGTPAGGIEAEVLVVSSFDELTARAKEAVGKIVVFNQDWVSYGVSVAYRVAGKFIVATLLHLACHAGKLGL